MNVVKFTPAQSKFLADILQQYVACDSIRASSIAGAVEPDSDAMMEHILKCLRALITFETLQGPHKSEKSKLFDVAIAMMSNLATSGLMMSINVWPSQSTSVDFEDAVFRPSETKRFRKQGADLQDVYTKSTAKSYFWAPIFFSMIMDDAPEELCLDIHRLYQEHQRYQEWAELRGIRCSLSCMEILFGSVLISDATRLHILCILRIRVPWLFFVKDEEDKYALHHAAYKKCSSRILQYVLRVNPAAANAQSACGETLLHSLLDNAYVEPKHFDQFKTLLAASMKAARVKDAGEYTPLALVCMRYGSSSPLTVLELLKAHPVAASTEDESGNLPIYYFCRIKCTLDFLQPLVPIAMRALMAAHPDAASEEDSDGDYLLHNVAQYCSLDMLELVYEAYPEAIRIRDCNGCTPLHLAALDSSVEKVQYLYSLHPEAAQMVTADKATLLHCAANSTSLSVLAAVYEYNPGAIHQVSEPLEYLPLHELVASYNGTKHADVRSEKLAMARFLLKKDPGSARALSGFDRTPYSLLERYNSEEMQRILLRAAPEMDPCALHRLNYEARRGALYLLFAAELPETTESSGAATSAETTMTMTMAVVAGPRRSARVKKAIMGSAASESERQPDADDHPTQREVPSKIWRLLKCRADTMLLKEIVSYL
jgi:hypothetical protein